MSLTRPTLSDDVRRQAHTASQNALTYLREQGVLDEEALPIAVQVGVLVLSVN